MASTSNSLPRDGKDVLELPIGYKFYPSDDQVIEYLKKKILGEELPSDIIPTINVYSCSGPDELPLDLFKYGVDGEWFFFTTRLADDCLHTGDGYWNPTGLLDEIPDAEVLNPSQERRIIGFKQTLDFYLGHLPNGTKTNWTIYEYRLNADQVVGQIDETTKAQIKSFGACRVRNHDKFRPAGGVTEEAQT